MVINKFERIQKVKELGLNTEDSILITKKTVFLEYANFLQDLDYCSIRTFDEHNGKNCPHYPYITRKEASHVIPELLDRRYSCILAKPINPDDCIFAGAALKVKNSLIIEIAFGPVTVRRVTHDQKIDETHTSREKIRNNRIRGVWDIIKKIPLDNVIIEFSYYRNPVGHKNENIIIWEVTDDGTGKSGL